MLFRLIKRRRAIERFVSRMPLDLQKRFGEKRHYSLEEVGRAVDWKDRAFVAFAYALFCSRKDFEDHYGQLKFASTYDGLRRAVSKRFFGGARDFDAKSLLRFADQSPANDFHKCHDGEIGA